MREFHGEVDTHAPFPHYYVASGNGSEFIICATCNHWVNRPMMDGDYAKCECAASCHAIVRSRNVTKSLSENLLLGASKH